MVVEPTNSSQRQRQCLYLECRIDLRRTYSLTDSWSPSQSLPFYRRQSESTPHDHRNSFQRYRCAFNLFILLVVGPGRLHEVRVLGLSGTRREGRAGRRERRGRVGKGREGVKGQQHCAEWWQVPAANRSARRSSHPSRELAMAHLRRAPGTRDSPHDPATEYLPHTIESTAAICSSRVPVRSPDGSNGQSHCRLEVHELRVARRGGRLES